MQIDFASKRQQAGLPWSVAGRLAYRAQRLAWQVDSAYGIGIRPEVEACPASTQWERNDGSVPKEE